MWNVNDKCYSVFKFQIYGDLYAYNENDTEQAFYISEYCRYGYNKRLQWIDLINSLINKGKRKYENELLVGHR